MHEFIDDLIKMMNEELGEKEVTIASSTHAKMEFVRKIARELEGDYDAKQLHQLIIDSQERLLQVTLKKAPFVPKETLSL